jgi:3-hydroxyacyl-[acyl-carrier-protein] dehydratase
MSRLKTQSAALGLGSNVIEHLLSHRRPMLMVDRVETFEAGPPPTIHASRYISSNEIFFEGHFPGLHIWPGCLTIEGMGQTGALLVGMVAIRDALAAEGLDPDATCDALRNLELGYRLQPGFRPDDAERLLAGIRRQSTHVAVGAAVDVKLLRPVFAGQRLDYRVTLVATIGDMLRFDAEATVDGVTVAAGSMTGARVPRTTLPRG